MNRLARRSEREAALDRDAVDRLLSYDAQTGIFRWKVDRSHRVRAGNVAGGVSGGYLSIEIADTKYRSHRIAWLLTFGVWPRGDLDHVNRVKTDNRLCNLREATRGQNCVNKADRPNRDVPRGVYRHKRNGRWVAQCGTEYLGSFLTVEEAVIARNSAAVVKYGAFAQP